MKSFWRKYYSVVVPLTISTAYLIFHYVSGFDLSESKNLADAMGGIITAISIVLSLFGVMLAIVIPAQTQTDSVRIFFKSADRATLISAIRNSLASGFVALVLSFTLYFSDILLDAAYWITLLWVFALLYLFCSAFRFIALFLSVLFTPVKQAKKKDNNNATEDRRKALDEALLKQNEEEDQT